MVPSEKLKQGARVAIIGKGAREHAIAWKLAMSPLEPELYIVPGNPGIWSMATPANVSIVDRDKLVAWAKDEEIDLVVIGPEQPLAEGVVDALTAAGIATFGPKMAAAQLESSKAFAKDLMAEAKVPTARYAVFTETEEAKAYVRELGTPIVIKADGLAAGKGVIIAQTPQEADETIGDMLAGNRFGTSGSKVVIEEFLVGQEVSLMYFVDKHTALPMVSARDFKRLGDGDTGPNTGGMGAFAPVETFVKGQWTDVVTKNIVHPVLSAMKDRDITYRGVLYVGLMMTADGPKVIEFNARFGDPETEVVLPLLESDLLEILWAAANDHLSEVECKWKSGAAVCVVVAGGQYPEQSDSDTPIELPSNTSEDAVIFHAGTGLLAGELVTAGGRVLTVAATDATVPAAKARAYAQVEQVHFDQMQYRRDIADNWQQ